MYLKKQLLLHCQIMECKSFQKLPKLFSLHIQANFICAFSSSCYMCKKKSIGLLDQINTHTQKKDCLSIKFCIRWSLFYNITYKHEHYLISFLHYIQFECTTFIYFKINITYFKINDCAYFYEWHSSKKGHWLTKIVYSWQAIEIYFIEEHECINWILDKRWIFISYKFVFVVF